MYEWGVSQTQLGCFAGITGPYFWNARFKWNYYLGAFERFFPFFSTLSFYM